MTTIAIKDKILAFDSKLTADGQFSGFFVKGRRFKNHLVAAAGSAQEIEAFLDWFEAGATEDLKRKFGLHEREVDIQALSIDRKGNIFLYEDRLYPYRVDAAFYAAGSGGSIAIGAMAAGASAEQALRIAAKFDSYTGGGIKTLSFDEKPESKAGAKAGGKTRGATKMSKQKKR